MFDLIIGTKNMEYIGIVLDSKTKKITIEKYTPPTRYIKSTG